MDSVEGKSNKSGIKWKGESVEWGGLELKALITSNDPVILHGLNSKIKYVRLVRRKVSGTNRFYANWFVRGNPLSNLRIYWELVMLALTLDPPRLQLFLMKNAT